MLRLFKNKLLVAVVVVAAVFDVMVGRYIRIVSPGCTGEEHRNVILIALKFKVLGMTLKSIAAVSDTISVSIVIGIKFDNSYSSVLSYSMSSLSFVFVIA